MAKALDKDTLKKLRAIKHPRNSFYHSNCRIMHPGDKMPWGKHKRMLIENCIRKYPQYIKWCLNNYYIRLDKSLYELYKECLYRSDIMDELFSDHPDDLEYYGTCSPEEIF